jgi:hypothetical protein
VARIDRARRAVARAEKILSDGDNPMPYEQAKANLTAARRELAQAQLSGGSAPVIPMPIRKNVEAASAEFRRMRTGLETPEVRREAFRLLVSKVFYADGEAQMECRLPAPGAQNCNQRECANSNLAESYPFVINLKIPLPPRWRAA